MTHQQDYDLLVIGSGAAGLALALDLADELKICVIAKADLSESNTRYAQGGVSAVMDPGDTIEAHIEDTLKAGAGLCQRAAVEHIVRHGQAAITWLQSVGVPFTTVKDEQGIEVVHLTQEGGHSRRRVVHADDATGLAIETTLLKRVKAHPGIELLDWHIAIDLITMGKLGTTPDRCVGAYVLDRHTNTVVTLRANWCVLATGGAGKVYLYTSNPDIATGDGVAMAWRAGCAVANMEFVQFHPTCLYHPKAKSFLVTEALRGEGARLLLPNGEPFMQRFDPRGELAPRDIVARAIDHEMKRLGADCVYLDISHKPAEFILSHFPTISQHCKTFGFDLTSEPLPVVPAAHYFCGGVLTDLLGRTSLPGLFAIGEVACTGLHGANRMASNSLLECLVTARSTAAAIRDQINDRPKLPRIPAWDESQVTDADEEVVVAHNWDELRRFMWDYVGIVRTTKRLERARRRVHLLRNEIGEFYANFRVTSDLIELRNLVQVAELVIRCALKRKESRGLHFTLDYPETDDRNYQRDTILRAGDFG